MNLQRILISLIIVFALTGISSLIIYKANNFSVPFNDDEKKQKNKKSAHAIAITSGIGILASAILTIVLPLVNNYNPTSEDTTAEPIKTPASTIVPTVEMPAGTRYSIYNEEEIKKRVDAINAYLASEGMQLKESDLVAFIYWINGDNRHINKDIYNRVFNALVNIDSDAVNFFGGFSDIKDQYTPIESIADIMMNEQDYLFVKYWAKKHDALYEMIYRDGETDTTIAAVEQYAIEMYRVFVGMDTITTEDGTLLSSITASKEVKYITNGIINDTISMIIMTIHPNHQDLLLLGGMIGNDPKYVAVSELLEKYDEFEKDACSIAKEWIE